MSGLKTALAAGGVLALGGITLAAVLASDDGPDSARDGAFGPSFGGAGGAEPKPFLPPTPTPRPTLRPRATPPAHVEKERPAKLLPEPTRGIRLITAPHVEALRETSAAAATDELFNNPNTYVVKFKGNQDFPKGWDAHKTLLYASFRDFAKASRDGIAKDVRAVVYDNEEWDQTPMSERRNADKYARKFRNLAHKQGLTFIAAPAPGVPGQRLFDADAKYADVLVVQAQGRESHAGNYAAGIDAATRYARAVNPDVKIVSEISSNPDKLSASGIGSNATGKDVHTAVKNITGRHAAKSDGFWPWTYSSTPAGLKHGVEMVKQLEKTTGD